MSVYIVRRALQSIAVMLVMATLVFIGVYMIGDPAQLLVSADADQADIDRMRRILGLDQPLWRQFLTFLVNLSQGDLGWSFAYGEPALGLVFQRMPATLELVFVAMVMALSVGIPLGLYAGLHPERPMARLLMGTSIIGISIPSFWWPAARRLKRACAKCWPDSQARPMSSISATALRPTPRSRTSRRWCGS